MTEGGHEMTTTGSAEPQLSRRALKKQQKKQSLKEFRAAKKEREKEEKAEEVRKRKAESDAIFDALSEEEKAERRRAREERHKERQAEKAVQRARLDTALASGPQIIIDLDFDDKMLDSEVVSLTQQLSYCQGRNSKADKALGIELTSCTKRIADSLTQRMQAFRQWQGVRISEESYTELHSGHLDHLVYLTADSKTVIETLEPTKKYIIGGLVDRNRHKMLCQRKAQKDGIRTARLPISEHVQLQGASVLTVDQVFAILLSFHAHGDWTKAITEQLPARKIVQPANKTAANGHIELNTEAEQKKSTKQLGTTNDAIAETVNDGVLPQKRKATVLEPDF